MNNLLNYTTVDLFLYDLVEGLGQSSAQIKEAKQKFWQRIYSEKLAEEQLEKSNITEKTISNYIELLNNQRVEKFKYPLDGYYYPVKSGDIYALQINCSGKENDSDWQKLSTLEQLPEIKEIIIEHTKNIPATLGQTWLIWGQIVQPNDKPEDIAEKCYEKIELAPNPKWKQDLKGQGTYQNATLFELEKPDIKADGINKNFHLIICLFPPDQTKETIQNSIGQLYRKFIQLFHYRNKIIWVYEQSRQLKEALKKATFTIQQLRDSISESLNHPQVNLNQLQHNLADALSLSHEYQINLGNLEEQQTNLETNINNYQKLLQILSQNDPNSDLAFLEKFSQIVENKYIKQIERDYQSLSAGKTELENIITTIQGIIDIEKTKNERILNKTVAIASVGIGSATLVATTFTNSEEIIKTIMPPISPGQPTPALYYWLSFGLAFGLSLIIGIILAWVTWLFVKDKNKNNG